MASIMHLWVRMHKKVLRQDRSVWIRRDISDLQRISILLQLIRSCTREAMAFPMESDEVAAGEGALHT